MHDPQRTFKAGGERSAHGQQGVIEPRGLGVLMERIDRGQYGGAVVGLGGFDQKHRAGRLA